MEKLKVIVTAVWSIILSALGILAIPVLLLVTCNLIDYFTGVAASKFRKQQIDSYKGIRGIAKKICMWLLIAVGAMLDILLEYAAENVGISLGGEYIAGSLAAVWLIANEVISILENIRDIGTPLPPFLMTIAGNIKGKAEDKIK